LRRCTETVDKLVLVLASTRPAAAANHVRSAPFLSDGKREGLVVRATLPDGLPVEVRVVAPRTYPTQMLFATGVPAHVERLPRIAEKRRLRLEPSGLRSPRAMRLSVESEADVYRSLALPMIPPEVREDEGELEAAVL